MDGAEPLDRGHRHRALVRLRHPSRHAAGGVAGDVRRPGVVLAEARGVLRPQPGTRRAADRPPLSPRGGLMMTAPANFIHGERVDAADGRTTELIDPSTGEAYSTAPL